MPTTNGALSINPPPLQPVKPSKSAVPRIGKRLKQALDIMVWDNKTDKEACIEVGFSITYLRVELRKPHVRSYYRGQLEVLRERESSRNIHTLVEVRDQKTNQMARVQAVKELEQLGNVEQSGRAVHQMPGLQIVVLQGVSVPTDAQLTRTTVDASKMIDVSDG